MKKALSILLSLLLVFGTTAFALTAAAEEPTIVDQGYCGAAGNEENVTWVLDTDGTMTISGTGAMADYRITYEDEEHPSASPWFINTPWHSHDDLIQSLVVQEGVTRIGNYAFYQRSLLSAITLPDSVREIGLRAFDATAWYNAQPNGVLYLNHIAYDYKGNEPLNLRLVLRDDCRSIADEAFESLSNLIELVIPDSVQYIGSNAFARCYALTDVTFGNGVTCIGDGAFHYCDSLTAIAIPNSVTDLGGGAFSWCSALESIDIPNTVIRMGDEVFYSCTGLIHATIGNGVKRIGEKAFSECTALKDAVLGESVESIGESAFENCFALEHVECGNEITEIESDVFYNCASITEFSIPDSVTSVGSNLFWKCTSLESVKIGSGLTNIHSYVFSGCSSIKDLFLGNTVEYIDDQAFFQFTALQNVFYSGTQAQWNQIEMSFGNEPLQNANIHYHYPNGHTAGEAVIENNVPATCAEAGGYDEVVYCTQCPAEISRTHVTVDPINHRNAYEVAAIEPTATAHGHTAGLYCPDCDTWLSGDVVHNALGAQTVIQAPTETEEGIVDIVCTVCGETFRYTAEKLPHTDPQTEQPEQPSGTGDTGNGFWMRIQTFFKGIIDWFLRLFKWLG